MENLWDAIVKIVRVDKEDPVKAWEEHNKTLKTAREILNEKSYKKLIFKGPGTDLEIELPEGHMWKGGSAVSEQGITFKPNMPTEEVCTLAHKHSEQRKESSTIRTN